MLILPCYFFGDVYYWSHLLSAKEFIIDLGENYVKQTQRNRTVILGPNGPQKLSIPIEKPPRENRKTGTVKISPDNAFRKEHLHSLRTAYGSSPFFDSFFPLLNQLYSTRWDTLEKAHNSSISLVKNVLKINEDFNYSRSFVEAKTGDIDLRIRKSTNRNAIASYPQVFENKFGFEPGLSILDLIFNEGPWAREYLFKISK